MSKVIKQDGTRKASSSTNITKKKSSSNVSNKPSTSKRDSSTDRKILQTTKESSQKTKASSSSLTNIKRSKNSSTVSEEITKFEKPIKPSSITSTTKSNQEGKRSANDLKSSSSKSAKVPFNIVSSPSTRVTRTQYFPSKNLYSNALKSKVLENYANERRGTTSTTPRKAVPSSERPLKLVKSTPTLRSTTESRKQHTKESSPETSSVSERPRTATLKQGSIVNENFVGPDPPVRSRQESKTDTDKPPSPSSDEYQYDDDFESYESDFEQYSSTGSGSTDSSKSNIISGEADDMSSESSNSSSAEDVAPRKIRETEKDPTQSSQTKLNPILIFEDERKLDSGNFDLPDFRHKRMLENIKESIEKENSTFRTDVEQLRHNPASLSDEGFEEQKSLQFINFAEAKKKYEHRKSLELKRKRGEEILDMIRLDNYSFTLFELQPVPYEVFIRNYGKSNTVQTSVQTGDDDINEETQTESIEYSVKWTQFPTHFVKINEDVENFWQVYKCNFLGVGSETFVQKRIENQLVDRNINNYILNKFLVSAEDLIMDILREETIKNSENLQKTNIPFSNGYRTFNTTSSDVLADCCVRHVSIFSKNCNKILSVHVKMNQSIICCWDISDFENAEYFLNTYDEVNCCSFVKDSSEVVIGGQKNGIISVWNVKEMRKRYDIFSHTPCYNTKIGSGHNAEIVSIQSFMNNEDENDLFISNNQHSLSELCSLDEYGTLIFWNLFKHPENSKKETDSISLVQIVVVDLKSLYPELKGLYCTDLAFNYDNPNYMYISTNYGFILQHLENGVRSNVKKFIPGSKSEATCLETCPFSPNYFLAGFSDGNIGLYSKLIELPLMVLSNKENIKTSGIQLVQWSRTKPFVLYAKDFSNNVHIWDLSKSDMYPEYSIPFGEENISCMRLSPTVWSDNDQKSFMVIGTESGKIYWHLLNSEHGPQKLKNYREQISTFSNYVNRL